MVFYLSSFIFFMNLINNSQRISFMNLLKNCNHKGLGIYYLLLAFIFGISGKNLLWILMKIILEIISEGILGSTLIRRRIAAVRKDRYLWI